MNKEELAMEVINEVESYLNEWNMTDHKELNKAYYFDKIIEVFNTYARRKREET